MKHLHERCLRLIRSDKLSSSAEILEKDGSVSVHHRNIQSIVIETFETKHGQSPEIVTDIFTQITWQYKFVQNGDCRVPAVNTVYHGCGKGLNIWEIVHVKIKETNSLNIFKKEIRQLAPQNCPCRLCKQFTSAVGFLP